MKKRSTATAERNHPAHTPEISVDDELEMYRQMRVRFAQADRRLYEISEEFTALSNMPVAVVATHAVRRLHQTGARTTRTPL